MMKRLGSLALSLVLMLPAAAIQAQPAAPIPYPCSVVLHPAQDIPNARGTALIAKVKNRIPKHLTVQSGNGEASASTPIGFRPLLHLEIMINMKEWPGYRTRSAGASPCISSGKTRQAGLAEVFGRANLMKYHQS